MKKALFPILSLFVFQFCMGQTKISILFDSSIKYDTVRIQEYDVDSSFHKLAEYPFASTINITSQKALQPGIYMILCDSTLQGAFLVSSDKDQHFTINISESDVTYTGSIENSNYKSYLDQLQNFERQTQALNYEYKDAQRRLPQYMLGPIADSLNARAERIAAEKMQYKLRTADENKGTLLSSLIRASLELPIPPKDITNNRSKLQEFFLQHCFDHFPWNDPNIFRTPFGDSKIREFCQYIHSWNRTDLDHYVFAVLDSAKANTTTYFTVFDKIEKILGYHGSTTRVERIYIPMLKDMLSYPNITNLRKRHCEYELSVLDKNHEGDIAPDFNIILSNGERSSLHDIQSEYLLLYFQHPTCPTCQRVRHMIAQFPILNKAIATGRLKVLTVYFEDEKDIWENYINSSEANPNYLHGWNKDQSILDKSLYETRAIPYMFLLDKDKRILKKNVLETELEDHIKRLKILD